MQSSYTHSRRTSHPASTSHSHTHSHSPPQRATPGSPARYGRTTATPQAYNTRSPMEASPFQRVGRATPVQGIETLREEVASFDAQAVGARVGGPGYGFGLDANSGIGNAQEKHRAQMASYRRNSDVGRAGPLPIARPLVDRLGALWQMAQNADLSSLLASLGEAIGPRQPDGNSSSIHHTIDDHSPRKRRNSPPWAGIAAGSMLVAGRRKRRWMIYIAGACFLYIFIVRPLLSTSSHPAYPGQQSSGAKATSKTNSKRYSSPNVSTRPANANHHKHKRAPRVSLPPANNRGGVIPDHPVENGLLRVDIQSSYHPIYQLIRDARIEWDAKVERQSKTLQEAVTEYRRRHRRNPPKGFDKWWKFIVENDVQLPDEYDQIERDILPFRALSPDDLRLRNDRASQFPDSYTLKVRKGSVRTSVTFDPAEIGGADKRMKDQVDLLKPIAKYLGDMQAVYSVHDTPKVVVSWGHRRELLDHVDDGEYIDADDEIDLTGRGWSAVCDPSTALRKFPPQPTGSPLTYNTTRTFVSSHSALMDICQHPELVPIHHVLSDKHPQVGDLLPLFSLSKTNLHGDILGIPGDFYEETLDVTPWRERTYDVLMWRGSNTGGTFEEDKHWKDSHRLRLVDLAMRDEGTLRIMSPPKRSGTRSTKTSEPIASTWVEEDWRTANEWYSDIAFADTPIQCDQAVCDELWQSYNFVERMGPWEGKDYKYVVDVDGNAWSARFQRLLKSKQVVFKSTIMPEWWTDRIQPWIHYVPIQVDYSDLYDALAFFRGTPSDPESGEEALAEEIANAARDYADTHWRRVDMTAYIFRLYLEWARLLAPRRWEMDFVYAEHMELARE